MARTKKQNGTNDQPAPGIGHNALSDDQLHALTAQHAAKYEASLKAKRAADKSFKDVCKAAHADLGYTAVDDIKDLIAGSTPEGESALKARIMAEELRQKRIVRWLGLAPGTEPSMFDNDRTPASDRAFAEGKRVGLSGGSCAPPHAAETEQYRRWMEGWHEGQAVLAKGFKKPAAEAKSDARAEAAARADEEKIGMH